MKNSTNTILKSSGLVADAANYNISIMNDDVFNTISDAYQRDKDLSPIIERLKHSLRDNLHDRYYWDESTDRLYLKASPNNRLCIPQCGVRLKLI